MSGAVVITGMGCISALGRGVEASWARIRSGKGAIRHIDRGEASDTPAWQLHGQAAWIENDDLYTSLSPDRPLPKLGKLDPLSTYAVTAALEAVDQAGIFDHPALQRRTAVLLGSGSAGNATIDTAYRRLFAHEQAKVHPQTIPMSMMSASASHVAMMLGAHGPSFVLSSACASSAHALGEALHMVRSGRVDIAIAGGTEACLTLGSWVAWQSLGVVASDTCRPFSRQRKGLILGEGAAVLVLEAEAHALARGARILGKVIGYGASADAAHMTAPDQAGIEMAIRAAHDDAGIDVSRPALISSHGTGTILNDATEAAAIRAVYGDALQDHLVIATKSAHGHLIGASAALEFLIGMKALSERIAPPILNHLGTDPECALPLALEPTPIAGDILVSNSFAFGGLNAVLIGQAA
jgi:nodulation protein E